PARLSSDLGDRYRDRGYRSRDVARGPGAPVRGVLRVGAAGRYRPGADHRARDHARPRRRPRPGAHRRGRHGVPPHPAHPLTREGAMVGFGRTSGHRWPGPPFGYMVARDPLRLARAERRMREMTVRRLNHLALLGATFLLAACAGDPAQNPAWELAGHPGLLYDVKLFYERNALEEDGRCTMPLLEGVT